MLKLNIKARRAVGHGWNEGREGVGIQDMRAWRKHQNDIH